jgi:metal-responsive CopG/Arc/MetJ family transcriptional regulator
VTQDKAWLARAAARRIFEAMSRINKDSETKKSGSRSERLAGALRENLRRRKAQERARGESQATGTAQKPAPARRDDPVR